MKTIIAGSRGITDYMLLLQAVLDAPWHITEVVSGRARGVDTLGELWAERNHVPVTLFPADWDRFGKRAGYVRNIEMARYADALLALWDGHSRGTRHMIDIAEAHDLKVKVVTLVI